jgi:hypothetical protein
VDGPDCVVTETEASCFLSSVSCPSTGFCITVDEFGNTVTSTNPTGGPSAWKLTSLGGPDNTSQRGVSCPNTGLCVAVANDNEAHGVALTSDNPAGGASAWTRTNIGGNAMNGVSCPTSGLCVAVSAAGLITSPNPTGR